MADFISLETAKHIICEACERPGCPELWGYSCDRTDRLNAIPASDVRPVIKCKNCRWWTKQEKSLQGRCELCGFYPTGEWFCANGERPNCGADMREPNLDTTKGDNHD